MGFAGAGRGESSASSRATASQTRVSAGIRAASGAAAGDACGAAGACGATATGGACGATGASVASPCGACCTTTLADHCAAGCSQRANTLRGDAGKTGRSRRRSASIHSQKNSALGRRCSSSARSTMTTMMRQAPARLISNSVESISSPHSVRAAFAQKCPSRRRVCGKPLDAPLPLPFPASSTHEGKHSSMTLFCARAQFQLPPTLRVTRLLRSSRAGAEAVRR